MAQRTDTLLRVLESALGVPGVLGPGAGSEVQVLDPAQTRTSEESSRSSRQDSGSGAHLPSVGHEGKGATPGSQELDADAAVAGAPKESASPGPASTGSGRGPRTFDD